MLLLTAKAVEVAIADCDVMAVAIDLTERALAETAQLGATAAVTVYPERQLTASIISPMGVFNEGGVAGGRVMAFSPTATATSPHRGFKLLFDLESLSLACLIEDAPIHSYMVGAHVGVATRWLSRPESRTLAVLGSGRMAMACADAICRVRAIDRIVVHSPDPDHRTRFAADAERALAIPTSAAASAPRAVHGADVVTCATNAHFRGAESVFRVDWLEPGTHVNTIGRSEADDDCYRRLAVIPVSLEAVLSIEPPWAPADYSGTFDSGGVPRDLAHVVANLAPGRIDDGEVTVYVGPSIAVEHLALASWVWARATALGVGTEWDLDRAT